MRMIAISGAYSSTCLSVAVWRPSREMREKCYPCWSATGVFLIGAALVGTLAFRAYANMLSVTWAGDSGTHDIDLAADNHYSLALPRPRTPINLKQTILDSGLGFFEVPALNRKQPSTSFKIRGRDFIVDVLAPMKGRETSRPVHLIDLGTYASPLRHLDYLLDDLQPAVLLYEHGILVNVPAPGRFAIHKCVVAEKKATGARREDPKRPETGRTAISSPAESSANRYFARL